MEVKFNQELEKVVSEFEKKVGKFSYYMCMNSLEGEKIPFEKKPAQQYLIGLGCLSDPGLDLSKTKNGKSLNKKIDKDVKIRGFYSDNKNDRLIITSARTCELLASAKIYLNTENLSRENYIKCINSMPMRDQPEYQNLATQVCHVQKIDMLVKHEFDEEGRAITCSKSGRIEKGAPAILLISAPALNFVKDANSLDNRQSKEYVEGMFKNIFHAIVSEGYQYIALPAAGLGVFRGNADLYFNALMKAAKHFPALNIIYHPAQHGDKFKVILEKAQPKNVVQATTDVVYGVFDVGAFWKWGIGEFYVGEEHIGAITTAPLNSLGLNPEAYQNIKEVNLDYLYSETSSDAKLVDKYKDKIANSVDKQSEIRDSRKEHCLVM